MQRVIRIGDIRRRQERIGKVKELTGASSAMDRTDKTKAL
jgi:hypothetical protein